MSSSRSSDGFYQSLLVVILAAVFAFFMFCMITGSDETITVDYPGKDNCFIKEHHDNRVFGKDTVNTRVLCEVKP